MVWQWHQLDHSESFAPCSRQITTPASHHLMFLQAGCSFSCRSNSVKTLTANIIVQEILKPRLYDTTGCQTGCTTGCIMYTNIQSVVKLVVKRVWQIRFDNRLNVCIHDTAGCQTGCQTDLTTGLTTVLNEQLFVQPVVKPGCTTGLTTGCIVYTNIYPFVKPVWQPVWQQVVSCKRGLRYNATDQQADSDVQFPRTRVRASRYRHSDTRQTCASRACLPALPVPSTAPCRHGCLALCR